MVTDSGSIPTAVVRWNRAVRIIRSVFPPIDLFEDIADPADWPLLLSAEQKTNPRLMETIGTLDLVPPERRVGGPGASLLMAPFTHVSPDRPSRFSDGSYGVLYVGKTFEVAAFETMHHHAAFMRATAQAPGWTSQFREIRLDVAATLHDIRTLPDRGPLLATADYAASQDCGRALRRAGSDGLVYPSVRYPGGECVGLFYPDLASNPTQARHLDYHFDGERVNFLRDVGTSEVFAVST